MATTMETANDFCVMNFYDVTKYQNRTQCHNLYLYLSVFCTINKNRYEKINKQRKCYFNRNEKPFEHSKCCVCNSTMSIESTRENKMKCEFVRVNQILFTKFTHSTDLLLLHTTAPHSIQLYTICNAYVVILCVFLLLFPIRTFEFRYDSFIWYAQLHVNSNRIIYYY